MLGVCIVCKRNLQLDYNNPFGKKQNKTRQTNKPLFKYSSVGEYILHLMSHYLNHNKPYIFNKIWVMVLATIHWKDISLWVYYIGMYSYVKVYRDVPPKWVSFSQKNPQTWVPFSFNKILKRAHFTKIANKF